MLFNRALALTLLLSSSAAAFNVAPSGGKKGRTQLAANKNIANVLTAGVISAATILGPLSGPAVAADSPVLGPDLETKLANFGEASYPVFNSVKDVSPLFDKLIEYVDKTVKAPDASEVAKKAVDGLLAIPDPAIAKYSGILKKDVFAGVSKDTCVTLGGFASASQKLQASAPIKSVAPAKMEALKKKFDRANSVVPVRGGDICLPGSADASRKLWVAQAELTLSMPKDEARKLVASVETAGAQTSRLSLVKLVHTAEEVFSKNAEALKMVQAGKNVEPSVISEFSAATKII